MIVKYLKDIKIRINQQAQKPWPNLLDDEPEEYFDFLRLTSQFDIKNLNLENRLLLLKNR